jgi:uncharacterized protein DUF3263
VGALDRAWSGHSAKPHGSLTISAGEKGGSPVEPLTELEMRILAFERSWWRTPGAKEREILGAFSISSTRYYQLLNELIDRPAAAQFDPALVTRLRRRRADRNRLRSGREA